jgi:DsbC/DsbD-like thiol-disulfide interchange protein
MVSSTLFFVLALSACGPCEDSEFSSAAARTSGPRHAATGPAETKHLTLTTSAPAGAVAPGTRVSLVIDITPKREMHVYAPGQKELIPISLTLEANRAVKAHAAKFPKPETFTPLDEVQLVYTKPFRVVQDVTVAPNASGTITIKGTLKYQACDNAICYAPVTVPVSWTVGLTAAVSPSSPR